MERLDDGALRFIGPGGRFLKTQPLLAALAEGECIEGLSCEEKLHIDEWTNECKWDGADPDYCEAVGALLNLDGVTL